MGFVHTCVWVYECVVVLVYRGVCVCFCEWFCVLWKTVQKLFVTNDFEGHKDGSAHKGTCYLSLVT